jgi:hypothetical protein
MVKPSFHSELFVLLRREFYLRGDVLKGQLYHNKTRIFFGVVLYWNLLQESFLTQDVVREFHCISPTVCFKSYSTELVRLEMFTGITM